MIAMMAVMTLRFFGLNIPISFTSLNSYKTLCFFKYLFCYILHIGIVCQRITMIIIEQHSFFISKYFYMCIFRYIFFLSEIPYRLLIGFLVAGKSRSALQILP